MKPLIIIPTLHESQHIKGLIEKIFHCCADISVVVVDGKSKDGTIEIVQDLCQKYNNLKLIVQEERRGFGAGLKYGFQYALAGEFNPVITMDGDCSHDPVYLNDFLKQAPEYDLVIGSRYINGVRVEGWKFRKLLMSKMANMYISYILVKPIWDFTSGFRCYSRDLIEKINIDQIPEHAYIVQIQLLHVAFKNRFRVKEIPFIYRDEENRISRVYKSAKKSTFWWVLKYRAPLPEILRHVTYVRKDYTRFVNEYDELINPPRLKKTSKSRAKNKYTVSVGVMAYNEEKNIGRCLDGLLAQKLKIAEIKEIIVVSSGSTDATDEIVRKYTKRFSIIKLILQEKRKGKASAINEFLKEASEDIVILESADTTTEPETVEELIKPFLDNNIGMVGAHPIPVNKTKSLSSYCVKKLWRLHHLMALDYPKCGEMIAFRNVISKISDYTAVDEAAIESILRHNGFELDYSPDAIVHNKGPETLKEFIRQRRRIASGHRHLVASTGHVVSTYSSKSIFKYVIKDQDWDPLSIVLTILMIGIEGFSRMVGSIDYFVRDKNPFIWEISKSTKQI